jgi:putative peptidoglycan lipid II flippase
MVRPKVVNRISTRSTTLVWFMGAILVGRVTGLARELILGNLYGASRTADLVISAFALPDALVNIILVSGFTAVLVPYLMSFPAESRSREFWRVGWSFVLLTAIVSCCLMLTTESVMGIFAPGLIPFSTSEIRLFRWVLGGLPLVVLSGCMIAWLMAKKSFVFGGLGTAIVNIAVVAGLVIGFFFGQALLYTVLGLLLGLALRLSVLTAACKSNDLSFGFYGLTSDHRLVRMIVLAAMAMSSLTLAPVLFRAIASIDGEGTLTLFSMTLKLLELPLTVVFWSIGFVALPELAELYDRSAEQATEYLRENLGRAGKLGIASFLFVSGPSDIWVKLIYGWGAFSNSELQTMSHALSIGAVGFPLMGLTTLLLNDQFALKRYPTVFSVVITSLLVAGITAWSLLPKYSLPLMFGIWITLYGAIGLSLWVIRLNSGLPIIMVHRVSLHWIFAYGIAVMLVLTGLPDLIAGAMTANVIYVSLATAICWHVIKEPKAQA